MRTEAPQPRPRYRNEAVFRSAERLLASQPKKPARTRPSRALVFLLGLACGVGLAFWFLRPTHSRGTAGSSAHGETSMGNKVGRKRPDLPRANATPTPAAAVTAPVVAEPPPAPVESTAAPTETPVAPAKGPRAFVIAPQPAARPAAGVERAPLGFYLTQASTLIKLRGELLNGPAGRRTIEFELYLAAGRLTGSVHGLVQLADGSRSGAPFRVTGRWLNRTITLNETVTMIRGSSARPQAHTFILDFPETDATDEILGSWIHAGFNGKLVLKIAPPF